TLAATFEKPITDGIGEGNNGNNDNGGENNNQLSPPTSNIQSKKIMISRVTTEPKIVEPGKPFTLTYRIENISKSKIDKLSLKLVNVEGKGTLDGFMPVDTTNEIYVGTIGYMDVRDVSITLCSDPNMKSGVYNFVTSVMFKQGDEKEEEITKISGIMVKAKPELELKDVSSMGDTIIGNVVNSGGEKLKKVNVKATIGTAVYEKYIGNIDKESEESFEFIIAPVESETEAKIEVSYEDNTGETYDTEGVCNVMPTVMEEENVKPGKRSSKASTSSVGLMAFIKKIFSFGV
ncbi:MAG: hypothetical protein ACRC7R_02040, partial [Sarcina sp.]